MLFVLCVLSLSKARAAALPPLGVDSSRVSVGGISSGADFAANFALAHSASIRGAAIWAGNAPRCYVTKFVGDEVIECSKVMAGHSVAGCHLDPQQAPCDPSVNGGCAAGFGLQVSKCQGCAGPASSQWLLAQNVTVLEQVAVRRGAAGLIDAPREHLRGSKIFLYRGGKDSCYNTPSVDNAAAFFGRFDAAVDFVNSSVASLHSIPTVGTGTPCGVEGNYTEESPHGLEACQFDGAGRALSHIYGPLAPAAAASSAHLSYFSQQEFDGPGVGLDAVGGFIYVPESCRSRAAAASAPRAGCGLHVFLHGCGMSAASGPPKWKPYAFNDTYARRAGFNEHAEANHLVVLYPQLDYGARAVGGSQGDNCWDQGGQTGDDYSDKSGAQVRAVQAMIERLVETP